MWRTIVKQVKRILTNSIMGQSRRTMLGRWKITHEPKAIHSVMNTERVNQSKVDWANVDYCGCCHGFERF